VAKLGIIDCGTLAALADRAEVVIAVCPPDAAVVLATDIIKCAYSGIYVDANAVSPSTTEQVCEIVESGGSRFVDGGIIGPPAVQRGTTRLYLAGGCAAQVADFFRGSTLEALVVGDTAGAASALKMCYAAWTKGSAALLLAVRALAMACGVDEALLAEWERSQKGLATQSRDKAQANAAKAWRFEGEMREIADTFAAAGLPDGFHRASAEVYRALADYKDCVPPPDAAEVLRTLWDSGTGRP